MDLSGCFAILQLRRAISRPLFPSSSLSSSLQDLLTTLTPRRWHCFLLRWQRLLIGLPLRPYRRCPPLIIAREVRLCWCSGPHPCSHSGESLRSLPHHPLLDSSLSMGNPSSWWICQASFIWTLEAPVSQRKRGLQTGTHKQIPTILLEWQRTEAWARECFHFHHTHSLLRFVIISLGSRLWPLYCFFLNKLFTQWVWPCFGSDLGVHMEPSGHPWTKAAIMALSAGPVFEGLRLMSTIVYLKQELQISRVGWYPFLSTQPHDSFSPPSVRNYL